jgi:replication factor A1
MIRMPYESIVEKIAHKSGLEKGEIEARIKKKLDQLSGLVSREGAAHIVANELGIRLFEQFTGKLKIKDILPGMRSVEVVGRLRELQEPRAFSTQNRTGKIASFLLGDETGSIRVVLWNEQAEKVNGLKHDTTVKIVGGYVRERGNQKEIHLNQKSKLIIAPEDEKVEKVKFASSRKQIQELVNGETTQVMATIVQVFDIRFFEVCPECGRRIRQKEDRFVCNAHGMVEPDYSYVMNAFVDDGTDSIRAVFFGKQAQKLMEKPNKDILGYRENPTDFEEAKTQLLGEIININGRVVKNEMFERLELIANNVTKADPEEEIKLLQQELEK